MSDNRIYIQDFTTARIMPWQNLPTTFAVEPKLSTLASNISDPGPKAYAFIGRDLGATATIGYTVGHGLYATFSDWYRDALVFGKRWFFILLPSGAGPSWVTARFKEPYTAKPNGGQSWDVTMVVEIRDRALKVNTVPTLAFVGGGVTLWSESLKSLTVTLSDGDTVAHIPDGNSIVKSAHTRAAGKTYWEILIVAMSQPYGLIGMAQATAPLDHSLESDGILTYHANGQIQGDTDALEGYAVGDVIGFALYMPPDPLPGTVQIYKNNVLVKTKVMSTGHPLYIAASQNYGDGSNFQFKIFTDTTTYAPPAGYIPFGSGDGA